MVQARDGRELGVLEDNEQVKCIDDILAPLRDRTHFAACQTLPRLQQRQVMERDHRVDLCDKPRAHKLPRAIDRDLGDVQLSLQRELDKEGDGEWVLAMQTNMHLAPGGAGCKLAWRSTGTKLSTEETAKSERREGQNWS
eukprot:741096-Hanusia_phi.AAC.2